MKIFLAIAVVCAVFVAESKSAVLSKEERQQKVRTIAKKCQEHEKATDADYEETISHDLPTTETGKCLRACLFESFGVLQGVKLDLEALDASIRMKTEDEAVIKASNEVAAECVPLSADTDRCALVAKFMACGHEKMAARGFDLKKLHSE